MEQDTKKQKVDGNGHEDSSVQDLSQFEFVRILADYSHKKVVCVEGRIKDKGGR